MRKIRKGDLVLVVKAGTCKYMANGDVREVLDVKEGFVKLEKRFIKEDRVVLYKVPTGIEGLYKLV